MVKIITAKWTSINRGSYQDLHYPVARFNEKGCLQVWGWRCSYALFVYFGTHCSKFS